MWPSIPAALSGLLALMTACGGGTGDPKGGAPRINRPFPVEVAPVATRDLDYAIEAVGRYDYTAFYQREIEFRRQWDYPPFTHLVLIVIRSAHQQRAAELLSANHYSRESRRLSEAYAHMVAVIQQTLKEKDDAYTALRQKIQHVSLNADPKFHEVYVEEMLYP